VMNGPLLRTGCRNDYSDHSKVRNWSVGIVKIDIRSLQIS
jgi:hypothetical protein